MMIIQRMIQRMIAQCIVQRMKVVEVMVYGVRMQIDIVQLLGVLIEQRQLATRIICTCR